MIKIQLFDVACSMGDIYNQSGASRVTFRNRFLYSRLLTTVIGKYVLITPLRDQQGAKHVTVTLCCGFYKSFANRNRQAFP